MSSIRQKVHRIDANLYPVYFLMGQTQFRRGEIAEMATGQMPDLIGIKHIDAKASKFEFVEVNVNLAAANDADFGLLLAA